MVVVVVVVVGRRETCWGCDGMSASEAERSLRDPASLAKVFDAAPWKTADYAQKKCVFAR